jgi:hypothetical protein
MVVHEAVGMADPIESIDCLRKHLEERSSVAIVNEDVLPRISSCGQMVDSPWVFNAQRSSHDEASLA